MKISFVCVGLWWLIFSQISFFLLPKGEKKAVEKKILFFMDIGSLKGIPFNKNKLFFKTFFISIFVYSLALQTIMLVAYFEKRK